MPFSLRPSVILCVHCIKFFGINRVAHLVKPRSAYRKFSIVNRRMPRSSLFLRESKHPEVARNFFGVRQHIVSQNERLRGELGQKERQLPGRACPVSIKENKVKRS